MRKLDPKSGSFHLSAPEPARLLNSRICPPEYRKPLAPRRALSDLVLNVEDRPVILFVGPVGFGKTVALMHLAATWATEKGSASWFGFDPSDDPITAIRYLTLALKASGLASADASIPPATHAVQALLAMIEETGEPWLLVLDDVDQASGDVCSKIIAPLLKFAPRNLHLALSSRCGIPPILAALDGRGLVTRVDAGTLRFNPEDLVSLAPAASDATIRRILAESMGWPALVSILAAEVRSGAGPANADAARGIASFVQHRLLATLSPAHASCAAYLAVLGEFSAETATAIFGGTTQDSLTALRSAGIVQEQPSDDGANLCVPRAIRAALVTTISRISASQARRRAARILLDRGFHVQAVRVASEDGDPAFAAAIAAASDLFLIWMRDGLHRLRRVLKYVPHDAARAEPLVVYARIISLVKAGKLRKAQSFLDEINACAGVSTPQVAAARALTTSLLAIYLGGDLGENEITELRTLASAYPALSSALLSAAATYESYILQQRQQWVLASQSAIDAVDWAEQAQSPYLTFFMHCDLAAIAAAQGATARARSLFDRAQRECQRNLREDERLSIIRDALRFELEHEVDCTSTADAARLRNVCRLLPHREGWPEIFAAAYRTYSEKLLLAQGLSAALSALTPAEEFARRENIPALGALLLAHRVFLLVLGGARDDAQSAFADLSRDRRWRSDWTTLAWRESEAFLEAASAIDILCGGNASLPTLQMHIDRAEQLGAVRSELRFRHLRARVRNEECASDPRIALLQSSSGFERAATLTKLFDQRGAGVQADVGVVATPSSKATPQFFTESQLLVLAKLEEGLSDKAIALALGISAHGVRYHLKRIYTQLSVASRSEAIAKARDMRLLG